MRKTSSEIVLVKKKIRLQEWEHQIEEQKSSGLNVQDWCTQNGIKVKTYYYHLRRVREEVLNRSRTENKQVQNDTTSHITAIRYCGRYVIGTGGEIMLKDLICGKQVYVVTGYTDLRKSIDGLAAIVQGQLEVDVFSKGVFLFCGRRCDRIKGLLWEGDGFLLLYKRLDNGKFQWPRNEREAKLLTVQQTRWLLEGLKIEQPKAIREGKPGMFY